MAGWPGPTGSYVFVEAETFSVAPGWSVIDEASIWGRKQNSSGLKSLGGNALGSGQISKIIDIPAAGTYQFWLRYSQFMKDPAEYRAPFRIVITQTSSGALLLDQIYDQTFAGGVPVNGSSVPNLLWESCPVTVGSGSVTVTISKVGLDKVTTIGTKELRQIDCMLFTTDATYEPNERDFGPQTYLRIRLNNASSTRIYFHTQFKYHRSPYSRLVAFDKFGYLPDTTSPSANFLGAGEMTPWMDITRLLYADGSVALGMNATSNYNLSQYPAASDYFLDFATAPNEASIVKTLQRNGEGGGIELVVPPDLNGTNRPKADYEFAKETEVTITQFPSINFGRIPNRFPLSIRIDANVLGNSPGVHAMESKVYPYLGINGVDHQLDQADINVGLKFGYFNDYIGSSQGARGTGYNDVPWNEYDSRLQLDAQEAQEVGNLDLIKYFKIGDEATAPSLSIMAARSADQEAYRVWLPTQGYTPSDFGASSWNTVSLVSTTSSPVDYVTSQKFRAWCMVDFYRKTTDLVHRYFPAYVKTSMNMSDQTVFVGNMYNHGNDYWMWFKTASMDDAWGEDWGINSTTPQVSGWDVALLRSATKYLNQSIHMYSLCYGNYKPLEAKLKTMSSLAQGAKHVEFYTYFPEYQGRGQKGWYRKWEMFPAVAELSREIGAAEDVLMDAMPAKAETAIIYSIPYDMWNVGKDNTHAYERMHTYLALRHAQVPVDVLSDDDARSGYLNGYKVIYLFGEQLDSRNVTPLVNWVKAGGTLVLSPGAGSKDELNRLSTALDTGLNLQRQPLQILKATNNYTNFWNSSKFLNDGYYTTPTQWVRTGLISRGKVTLRDAGGVVTGTDELLVCQQTFGAMPTATVLATFADNTSAAVSLTVGSGKVFCNGFMPALSYIWQAREKYLFNGRKNELVAPLNAVKQALATIGTSPNTILRSDYLDSAFEFDTPTRDWIIAPTKSASVAKPVDVNIAQVEATFMTGTKGWVVPLANYTGSPTNVTVTVRPGKTFGAVYSSRQGVLMSNPTNGTPVSVSLSLESTDILYAKWNTSPAVTLALPAGTNYTAPANITMNANATDGDGTITNVEFYNGSTLLGTSTASPYSFTWNGVAAGTYSLTAKAYDNNGAVTTSAAVTATVIVRVNVRPTVSITAPTSGASFTAPASINVSANASDSDGTITKVEFYNGNTLLGTATASPYAFMWNGLTRGSYSLTAKAYDNEGAVTTSSAVTVTVTGNVKPTVSITSPVSGAGYTAPASINVNTNASDSDGTITKVEFYNGSTLLGTSTAAPYSFIWNGVTGGSYSLTAKAYDNDGAITASGAVTITVTAVNTPPTVSLTAPVDGTTVNAPYNASLLVSASDSDGTITKVEFYQGSKLLGTDPTAPYEWSWRNNPVGSYSLTAKAYDNRGAMTVSNIVNIQVNANTSGALPSPFLKQDIGDVGVAGASGYTTGNWTLSGGGAGIRRDADAFHFVSRTWTGDGQIIARVSSVQTIAGIMIRESLAPDSRYVMAALRPDGATFWDRPTPAGITTALWGPPAKVPYWFKLVRYGSSVSGYQSSDSVNWTFIGTQILNLPSTVYMGLAVSSEDPTVLSTATFDHVTIAASPLNGLPTLTLTSPQEGTSLKAPASVTLNATASDSDGSILQVYLYKNGRLFAIDRTSPYTVTLDNIAVGSNVFTARVTDNKGATIASNSVTINVSADSGGALPSAWSQQTLGIGVAGSSSYLNGKFTVNGAGGDIVGTADGFHFVYQPWTGDGQLIARMTSIQETNTRAKAGIMLREDLSVGSRHVSMMVDPADYSYFSYRTVTDENTTYALGTTIPSPFWIKLVRSGATITGYRSSDGVTWVLIGTQTMSLPSTIYVGLGVVSRNNTVLCTATFDQVSIQ